MRNNTLLDSTIKLGTIGAGAAVLLIVVSFAAFGMIKARDGVTTFVGWALQSGDAIDWLGAAFWAGTGLLCASIALVALALFVRLALDVRRGARLW